MFDSNFSNISLLVRATLAKESQLTAVKNYLCEKLLYFFSRSRIPLCRKFLSQEEGDKVSAQVSESINVWGEGA